MENSSESEPSNVKEEIKLYKKRWLILFLYTSSSFLNSYQWIHLNIISERVAYFWNNSLPQNDFHKEHAINWLALIYFLAYLPLIIPATWFLNQRGLKDTCLVGCFLNALGAWIKCAAVSLDGHRFPVLLLGQTIAAVAQVFIIGIPSFLAGAWFGVNELSTATSIGVFGNQLGIGFGFVLTPLIFSTSYSNGTMREYEYKFNIMFYSGAGVMTVLFILMCIVITNKPPTPPSLGQISVDGGSTEMNFKESITALSKNLNFVSLNFSFGINAGCFYSLSIVLNSILLHYYKNDVYLIGVCGLVMIIAGIVGSIIIGIILDKTKAFKSSTILYYVMSVISMGAFTGGLYLNSWIAVFTTMILLGFFMTGYIPLSFELAAEMTFPINEGLTSGLLNFSCQLIAIVFTYIASLMLSTIGPLYLNISFTAILIVGAILTILMKVNLKRQTANSKVPKSEDQNGQTFYNTYL